MRNLTTTICLTVALLFGCTGVCKSADFEKGLTAYESGDYATAVRVWTPLAKQGDAAAQYIMGVMYELGRGVPQDYKTAVKWFRLAAEQGNANAQYSLGFMYDLGDGVLKDYVYAHMWYNIAASSGKSKNASKNRDIVAGKMTPSQLEKAQDLARECVRKKYKGCESADFQKGLTAYQSGDYATALREWTPLAKQGNALAQSNLGGMYDEGKGVPQDYKTAVKWYRLAAEQGNANAQGNLGALYAFGEGVLKDYVYAHMWLNIVASNGNEGDGKLRDFVAKQMTPPQLKTAQKLARECVRKKYKGC